MWEARGEWSSAAPLCHPPFLDLAAVQARFVPKSPWLAVGSDSRDRVTLIDLKSRAVYRSIPTKFEGNMAVSSDGLHIAVGCDDDRLRVWQVESAELLFETDEIGSSVTALIFSADGRTLLSGHKDGTVRMWHVPSHRSLGVLRQSADPKQFAWSLDISADGQQLVAACSSAAQPSILLLRPGLPVDTAPAGSKRATAD